MALTLAGLSLGLLAGCGEEARPDGSFEVLQSRGARADVPEPVRTNAAERQASANASNANPAEATQPNAESMGPGQAAGLRWTIPAAFEARPMPPAFGNVYLDFCIAPKQGDETHDGYLVSSQTAGSIEANLARWKGQFPEGQMVEERALSIGTSNPLRGAFLAMEGPTYSMRASLWPEGPPTPVRALFAAIEGPAGVISFRYLGTPANAQRLSAAFAALVESVQRQEAAGNGGGE